MSGRSRYESQTGKKVDGNEITSKVDEYSSKEMEGGMIGEEEGSNKTKHKGYKKLRTIGLDDLTLNL
jgi:hypothetical protein